MSKRVMSDGRIYPHSSSDQVLAYHPVMPDSPRLTGRCQDCGSWYHTVQQKNGNTYLKHDPGTFWRD